MSKMLIIEIDGDVEKLWDTMFGVLKEKKTEIREEEAAKRMFIAGLTMWGENIIKRIEK